MSWLDRLFGRAEQQESTEPQYRRTATPQRSDDEIAVERYQYLLRTAPPETIEQVHQEAFSKLSAEQRDLLFQKLTENAPAGDEPRGRDAASLATSATRSELRQPGTMERAMGPQGGGMGFGGVLASSLLGTVAGYVIGSALVSAFLPDAGADASGGGEDSADSGDNADSGDAGASGDGGDYGASADGGDYGGDYGGGGDFGGGGFGGDFGGGDFGGGDF
jgi:hypothetical protein